MNDAGIARKTLYKCVCPQCGHVGTACLFSEVEVACRECGAVFPVDGHTFRPKTQGMTELERKEHRARQKRERDRRRRASDPEAERERRRVYYKNNADHFRAYYRSYHKKHRAERLVSNRKWRQSHPLECRRLARRNQQACRIAVRYSDFYGTNERRKAVRLRKRERDKARYRKGDA